MVTGWADTTDLSRRTNKCQCTSWPPAYLTNFLQKFHLALTTARALRAKVSLMKVHALAIGLATGLAVPLFAGETLRLKIQPDHEYLVTGSPQEVVVKIGLTALDGRRRTRRTPLNLAVVLDRSGSMSGAKIEKAR